MTPAHQASRHSALCLRSPDWSHPRRVNETAHWQPGAHELHGDSSDVLGFTVAALLLDSGYW